MNTQQEIIEGFKIFDSYDNVGDVSAEHDIIYAGPDPEIVSDEDKEKLKALGWLEDDEYDCFSKFV